MPELSAFQEAFCAALEGRSGTLAPWLPADPEPPGLSVYRNTVVKGSVDALAATHETVVRLVGEDWFRAAAIAYVRASPPTQPSLLAYGCDFAEWLAAFPPAQDAPYLAGIAGLDRLWQDAYFAAEAEPLGPEAFAGLTEADLARLSARLHPSVGLAAFDQNLVSLWLAHHGSDEALEGFELIDAPEQALVVRRGLEVEVRRIDGAAHAFLAACAAGESLTAAAERALAADPAADFPQIIGLTLAAGAFRALEPVAQVEIAQ